MVFFPLRTLDQTPREWGLDFEDVHLETSDGARLHGWFIPAGGEHPRGTLLFLHGNAGNISHRGDSVRIFHRLGLDILIIDYRGYGQSSGSPSEEGLYTDARTAWHYLTVQRNIPAHQITLFGRSLGGVVATRLASEVRPARLIVESSFSSARDMARSMMPWLSHLLVMRFDFDAARYIRDVQVPVLILHSPQDEIIPFALGQRLYQQARQPKTFVRLHGVHNYGFILSQPAYQRALQAFLDSDSGKPSS
ncbi:MAG TPA: alpha/beta hydrolase [Gammaproteobacteria bacterium]|nr:alpha/beta hydrolase [Gammaproteobacteria bacterium]